MYRKFARSGSLFFALIACSLAAIQPLAAQGHYKVVDLGTLPGGNFSSAAGINNRGAVTGQSSDANGNVFVFLWEHGGMAAVPPLPGTGSIFSLPGGINSQGDVVGTSYVTGAPDYDQHGFLYESDTNILTDLGTLPGDTTSIATAINGDDAIIGGSFSPTFDYRAFIWRKGVMTNLGMLPNAYTSYSFAYGINNKGTVVGTSAAGDGTFHAVAWHNGSIQDLGTLGGAITIAYAVNAKDQIVGNSNGQAFLWQNGHMTALPNLPNATSSSAGSINIKGEIVGTTNFSYVSSATLWRNGKAIDLNTLIPAKSGWVLRFGGGINNAGWIVGSGIINGAQHAFLLKPR